MLDDEIIMMIMMMMMTSPTLNCSASSDDLSGAASLDSIIRRSSTIPSVRPLQGRSQKYYPHLIDGSMVQQLIIIGRTRKRIANELIILLNSHRDRREYLYLSSCLEDWCWFSSSLVTGGSYFSGAGLSGVYVVGRGGEVAAPPLTAGLDWTGEILS